MKMSTLACCLLLSLSAAPLAQAQEEEAPVSPFTGTFAVTSDYVSRGVSQTNGDPAFQAGLTYKHPSGFYVAAWTSNVDPGEGDPDWEVDTTVGYGVELGKQWDLDVAVTRYNYPGAGETNYNELVTKTTFLKTYSLTVGYTNDLYGTKTDGYYYALDANWPLPHKFSIGAHVGHTRYTSALKQVDHDYNDYAITVGKSFGPLALNIGYYDTSEPAEFGFGRPNTEGRTVATATVTWP
ncbi:TorF family putative porin [Xanthomonas oryzae]|uniref:TorF family putative porin n=1 Tax=Xanthomonas oryzae TaxID=347 RepID=UPI00065625B7|nr:TorF family putative porin [Xanthomonas oryzae]AKO11447.1 hypothetical protein ACU14_04915 [Xanthomonas oryzae pv. oryzicola]